MKNTMITGINAIDIAREEILLGTMTPERLSELAAISETPIDEDSVVQDYILENIYPDEEYNEAETLALEQIADVPRYRGFYDKYMVGHCDSKYYATNYSSSDGQEICYYTAHCIAPVGRDSWWTGIGTYTVIVQSLITLEMRWESMSAVWSGINTCLMLCVPFICHTRRSGRATHLGTPYSQTTYT